MTGRAAPILVLSIALVAILVPLALATHAAGKEIPYGNESITALNEALQYVSPESKDCITCHLDYTPTIVYEWLHSKHAHHKPADVLELYRAIGDENEVIADKFKNYQYTVSCYECHGMFKDADRPDVINHFGYQIVTIVTVKDCSQCHPKEAREISWTMHAFAALNAPLGPWYSKIIKYAKENNKLDMLPNVYENTGKGLVTWEWYKEYAKKILEGKLNDPEVQMFGTPYDHDFKEIISPLYPASGVLNTTVMPKLGFKASLYGYDYSNIMEHPYYKNAYVYHGCMECHGSLVVPYKKEVVTVRGGETIERVEYWGWPSNGAGRVDPDGSIGTCTACHVRHEFSIEFARKPHTCGQCHLGYDHPHIEVYEESKHGNIYDSEGEKWNWEALPWRAGVDFTAPTCATCHMSTLALPNGTIVVKGSHDLRSRIVWDTLHFYTFPKPKWADFKQNAIIKGGSQLTGAGLLANNIVPEGYKLIFKDVAQKGELKFPRVVEIQYTGELAEKREAMKKVCLLCHSSQWVDNYFKTYDQNLIDYNITAVYAHTLLVQAWNEGIHDPSNKLDEYMEMMWYYIWHHDGRRWRHGAAMMGPDYAHWFGIVDTVMDKLGRMTEYYKTAKQLQEAEMRLKALEAAAQGAPLTPELAVQIQQLRQLVQQLQAKLQAMEAQLPKLMQNINEVKAVLETLGNVPTEISQISKQIQELSKLKEAASKIQELSTQVNEVKSYIEASAGETKAVKEQAASLSKSLEELAAKLDKATASLGELAGLGGVASTAIALSVIAIIVSVIGIGVVVARRK